MTVPVDSSFKLESAVLLSRNLRNAFAIPEYDSKVETVTFVLMSDIQFCMNSCADAFS